MVLPLIFSINYTKVEFNSLILNPLELEYISVTSQLASRMASLVRRDMFNSEVGLNCI